MSKMWFYAGGFIGGLAVFSGVLALADGQLFRGAFSLVMAVMTYWHSRRVAKGIASS